MSWQARDIPDVSGKVAVVTGGNGGLGYETSLQLAAHGATVVIGARNAAKAETARQAILAKTGDAHLEIVPLDLASLASVEKFASEVSRAHPKIDLLFNNAGVMAVPEGKTADGFETQFGTNVLGHFALTMRLMPALIASGDARVVNTSSMARFVAGKYDLTNPYMRDCYDAWTAYGMSKRAALQWALELDRRVRDRGVRAFAADPGFSHTNLQSTTRGVNGGIQSRFWGFTTPLFAQSAATGALPQLRAATDPGAVGGTLYAPRWRAWGAPIVRGVGRSMRDPDQLVTLWQLCERETGLTLERALAQAPASGRTPA